MLDEIAARASTRPEEAEAARAKAAEIRAKHGLGERREREENIADGWGLGDEWEEFFTTAGQSAKFRNQFINLADQANAAAKGISSAMARISSLGGSLEGARAAVARLQEEQDEAILQHYEHEYALARYGRTEPNADANATALALQRVASSAGSNTRTVSAAMRRALQKRDMRKAREDLHERMRREREGDALG